MSIDFRVRDFFSPTEVWTLHRTLEKTQWLPREQLEAYQDRKLREVLNLAYDQVPYYQELFSRLRLHPEDIRGITDLAKLPLLSKRTLKRSGEKLLAARARSFGAKPYKTSGTSGQPLSFYLDKRSNALEFVYYWRYWGWGGYRLGSRFAELSSHYFLARPELAEKTYYFQPHLNRLVLNSSQVSVKNCKRMASALRKYHPRFLKGMPSILNFFAHSLKEAKIDDLSFKSVFSTGEVLTDLSRALIEKVLNTRILDSYGHMERTVAIAQCPQGGYHVNSDYGILELEEAAGITNGSVRVRKAIGTSLYNRAMPLIRYDLGDHIEVFPDERDCPCGRTLPLIKAIHGRCEDSILTPDGRFITSLFIVPEFVPGIQFVQFVQTAQDRLQIRVVPAEDWEEDSVTTLLEYTRRMTGSKIQASVEVVPRQELIRDRSGKIRCVIGLPDREP